MWNFKKQKNAVLFLVYEYLTHIIQTYEKEWYQFKDNDTSGERGKINEGYKEISALSTAFDSKIHGKILTCLVRRARVNKHSLSYYFQYVWHLLFK